MLLLATPGQAYSKLRGSTKHFFGGELLLAAASCIANLTELMMKRYKNHAEEWRSRSSPPPPPLPPPPHDAWPLTSLYCRDRWRLITTTLLPRGRSVLSHDTRGGGGGGGEDKELPIFFLFCHTAGCVRGSEPRVDARRAAGVECFQVYCASFVVSLLFQVCACLFQCFPIFMSDHSFSICCNGNLLRSLVLPKDPCSSRQLFSQPTTVFF